MNKEELATYLRGIIDTYIEDLATTDMWEIKLFGSSDEIIMDGLDNAWYISGPKSDGR